MVQVDITIPAGYFTLGEDFRAKVDEAVGDEARSLSNTLQQNSPRGATGDLINGYGVQAGVGPVMYEVTNDANRAYNRIVGRGPGKATPIDALEPWVRQVLGISEPSQARGVAYVIGRRHAREGSGRYRNKSNALGIDPVTQAVQPGSPIRDAEQNLAIKLNQGQLPR